MAHIRLHISTKPRSGAAFERGIGSSIPSLLLLLLLLEHTPGTQRTERIRTMPCAAGELCMVPARTPERPDGHECRGKCGGRLQGLCGEADPDCDNPMQRVYHDCLAAKRSSKGKGKAVKAQAGKCKASDTGGVGAGPWKNAKSGTDNTGKITAHERPPHAAFEGSEGRDLGAARPEGVTSRDSRLVRVRSANGFQNRGQQGAHDKVDRIRFDQGQLLQGHPQRGICRGA